MGEGDLPVKGMVMSLYLGSPLYSMFVASVDVVLLPKGFAAKSNVRPSLATKLFVRHVFVMVARFRDSKLKHFRRYRIG